MPSGIFTQTRSFTFILFTDLSTSEFSHQISEELVGSACHSEHTAGNTLHSLSAFEWPCISKESESAIAVGFSFLLLYFGGNAYHAPSYCYIWIGSPNFPNQRARELGKDK